MAPKIEIDRLNEVLGAHTLEKLGKDDDYLAADAPNRPDPMTPEPDRRKTAMTRTPRLYSTVSFVLALLTASASALLAAEPPPSKPSPSTAATQGTTADPWKLDERSACRILTKSEVQAAGFDNWSDYVRWRHSIELLRFDASTNPESGTFTGSLRNVTPNDEVYLRIDNGEPLTAIYEVKVKVEDAPDRTLLNSIGPLAGATSPLAAAIAAAGDARDGAQGGAEEPEQPAEGGPAASLFGVQHFLPSEEAASVATEGPALAHLREALDRAVSAGVITVAERQAFLGARAALEPGSTAVDDGTAKLETAEVAIGESRSQFPTLANEIEGLKAELQKLDANWGRFEHIVVPSGDHTEWRTRLEALTEQYLKIAGMLDSLSSDDAFGQLEEKGKAVSATLVKSEKVMSGHLDAARGVLDKIIASAATSDTDAGLLTRARAELKDPLTRERASVESSLDAVKTAVADVKKNLGEVRKQVTAIPAMLSDLRSGLTNATICLDLGHFEAGKKVTVTATRKKRPRVASAASTPATKPVVVTGTGLKADAASDKTRVTVSGKIGSVSGGPPGSGTSGGSSGNAPRTANGSTPKKSTGGSQPPPADPGTETSFEVLSASRVRMGLGPTVSWVEDPEFDHRDVKIESPDEDGQPVDTDGVQIFRSGGDETQVLLGTYHIGLYLRPRYLFRDHDDVDPFESVNKRDWRDFVYPTVGFSLSAPSKNLFAGLGIDLSRGVSLIAGLHFSEVTRLIDGFEENMSFVPSGSSTFDINDYLEDSFRHDIFVAITLEPRSFLGIFGGHSK